MAPQSCLQRRCPLQGCGKERQKRTSLRQFGSDPKRPTQLLAFSPLALPHGAQSHEEPSCPASSLLRTRTSEPNKAVEYSQGQASFAGGKPRTLPAGFPMPPPGQILHVFLPCSWKDGTLGPSPPGGFLASEGPVYIKDILGPWVSRQLGRVTLDRCHSAMLSQVELRCRLCLPWRRQSFPAPVSKGAVP
jgi:hypothetical protein